MRSFFLDTADPEFVVNARNQLRGIAGPLSFIGVTTNPKAVAGYCKEQGSARRMIEGLGAAISDFRGDNQGELFVQLPGSDLSFNDMVRFIEHTYNWGRPYVQLGYKLPHFRTLEVARELFQWNRLLNVTGVTDFETAAELLFTGVKYISFLTGRMEERGIQAMGHINATMEAINTPQKGFNGMMFSGVKLIAGSMRTVEQLNWVWQAGMVPTIGRSLWQDITDKDAWRIFQVGDQVVIDQGLKAGREAEQVLSQEFFTEMDGYSEESAKALIWG